MASNSKTSSFVRVGPAAFHFQINDGESRRNRTRACRILVLVFLLAAGALTAGCSHHRKPSNVIRVGVLKYGSVDWEMAVIKAHHLASGQGIRLKIVPLASKNALGVALHSGRVDAIVSDWLWTARQDHEGSDYRFFPYSLTVGAVMVNPASGIETPADLKGKKIGIAGGEFDKTWLLLRAWAIKNTSMNIADTTHPVYASPPILAHLLQQGKLPAVINYWQYDARAKAAGMTPLITVRNMLTGLGIKTVPPLLGWVFSSQWAQTHGKVLQSFLRADYRAKAMLGHSRQAWASIRKLVKPGNDHVLSIIEKQYRAGIPRHYGKAQIQAAHQLFHVLAQQGGQALTGGTRQLPDDLFWRGMPLP